MNARITPIAAALVVGAVALAGCESTLTGEEGNLEFSYTTVDDITDFNKPIAVGARLDLRVKEAGSSRAVEVQSAESSSTSVLAVADMMGNTVVLEGVGEGSSRIQVQAELGSGRSVEDFVTMQAAVPDVLDLRHHCVDGDGDTAAYLAETEVWIPFDMFLDNGRSVIGYGYHPVDVQPAGSLGFDEDSKDQRHFRVTTPASDTSLITLSSQVDDATLSMEIVEGGDITGAVRQAGDPERSVRVDASTVVRIVPTVDSNVRVCCPKVTMQVDTDTPEICSVSVLDDEAICLTAGFVRVEGEQPGACEYTVTYPDAMSGAGVSASFAIEVQP